MNITRSEWGFLLDQLCRDTAGVAHAVVLSADGLPIAHSTGLESAHVDQLSAFTSGMSSLTSSIASLMQAGPVEQTVVDLAGGRVFVMAINEMAVLTVLAAKTADMGQVVYEMAMLTNRAGAALTPQPRTAQQV